MLQVGHAGQHAIMHVIEQVRGKVSGSQQERPLSARLVCVPIFGRHFRVHQLTSFVVGCFEKED